MTTGNDQDLDSQQVAVLMSFGLEEAAASNLVRIADWLSTSGGTDRATYWMTAAVPEWADERALRDERFTFGAEVAAVMVALQREDNIHGYAIQFAGAFGYIGRSILQSLSSIDLLVGANCYVDALSICRTLVGRVNLLTLFALNPWLFDDWLRQPTAERFLDGKIRDLLDSHGIEFFGRLYDELSEAIHLHQTILAKSGYLERGLFPVLSPMSSRLYVIAKLLLGQTASIGIAMLRQDYEGRALPELTFLASDAFDKTKALLAPNRLEHIAVTIAPDRHWTKVGKEKYAVLTRPDEGTLRDQVEKFHRDAGQRKTLRRPYDISQTDADVLRTQQGASSTPESASEN
jgi:hypothetical protein